MDFSDIIQEITDRSTELLKSTQWNEKAFTEVFDRLLNLSKDGLSLSGALLKDPQALFQAQSKALAQSQELWAQFLQHGLEGKALPISDRRFGGEEWLSNPYYNALSQHYLLASDHINSLLEHLKFEDEATEKRIKFLANQYLQAIAPNNFLLSNPELIKATLESHGKNLIMGLKNFLNDIEPGTSKWKISMTDKSHFEVGVNLATTKGSVIYRSDLFELIQYHPQTEKVKSIPLLIVPPWINKYYIMDLSPENSMVDWLVKQGQTVFLMSWINPDKNHAHLEFSDYILNGPLKAIECVKKQMAVEQVNTLGFCNGGTLLSMALAYNKAHGDTSVHSASFLATLIDFSDHGEISVYIDEAQVAKLEAKMETQGYLEGDILMAAFSSLRATDLIWSFYIKNYLEGKPPAPFDLLYWNTDPTNMAAKMYSQYLRWLYLQNDLIQPGKIKINKTPIDISAIDIPVCFISTEKDHIAPWKTTYIGFSKMKSPSKNFILGGSGHIAGIINPPSKEKYGYYMNTQTPNDADAWFASAKSFKGSWWPKWMTWLKKESGSSIAAPDLSILPLQELVAAPGTYVLKKNK